MWKQIFAIKSFFYPGCPAAACLLAACFIGAAHAAPAQNAAAQGALPAFQALDSTGTLTDSAQLSPETRYLLIYVKPNCRPCDELLISLERWNIPNLPGRSVILIGAPLDEARTYIQSFGGTIGGGGVGGNPDLPTTWFSDHEDQAWDAFSLQGAPAFFGIRDGDLIWRLSGILNDPKVMESVVRAWVE